MQDNDLISRDAALDAIDCWHIDFNSMDGAKVQYDCRMAIKGLPAVDAALVVHGRWILEQNGSGVCAVCNRSDHIDRLAKYCRFCGAKMDGGDE